MSDPLVQQGTLFANPAVQADFERHRAAILQQDADKIWNEYLTELTRWPRRQIFIQAPEHYVRADVERVARKIAADHPDTNLTVKAAVIFPTVVMFITASAPDQLCKECRML
jgi:hypothetical protein